MSCSFIMINMFTAWEVTYARDINYVIYVSTYAWCLFWLKIIFMGLNEHKFIKNKAVNMKFFCLL